jgi:uncharacterized secreted protein with C-terminal beta-propeller domain
MKNIFLLLILVITSVWHTFAAVEDTSVVDELNKTEVKNLDFDFKLKSFKTCDWLEKVMGDYIKDYWKNNKDKWGWPILYRNLWWPVIMEDSAMIKTATTSDSSAKSTWGGDNLDYSKTNVQVEWVDESDIVKTDWKYIYYYNETDKYVYIVGVSDLSILKKIKLPDSFYSPVLYIWWNKLTIIASGYSNTDYSKLGYWIDRNSKTYTIVFDTTDITNPVLSKMYVADWNLMKTRKIWDLVYVVSNNNFSIPYYNFKTIDDIKIDSSDLLPKKIDISKTTDTSKQNLKLRWKNLPYNITSWDVAKCSDIEYVLPDKETIKQYDFAPSYNIISIIDTKNTSKEVKTKVIAWSNDEIYMSLDNMYLTSNMYQTYDFACPMNARCFAPWFSRWTNTLLHKLNISWSTLKYQDSTIIPGSPLTGYSMDEYKTDFRILTLTNNWNPVWNESHTDLYVLDKDLKLKWSLKNIWSGEQFKSSRYIWDKLFLVTFEQTDPLFAIDVSNSAKPKILWELKIPGFSTYLHPYDENHLIWLGYDTKTNQWWWTITNWLKVDLYEINYDKKCGDSTLTSTEKKNCDSWVNKWIIVNQKYSQTLWEYGSYSEALDNPRMFMWKASDKKLFLPVTLYNNYSTDIYRHKDFFQWLVTMTIDKDKWIKENFRLTHLDTTLAEKERQTECSKYTKWSTEKKCVKLIWWWEYCEAVDYNYVPTYCYADSTIWEYIASKNWEFSKSFIKRALWIWTDTYSLSDDLIKSTDIITGIQNASVNLGK